MNRAYFGESIAGVIINVYYLVTFANLIAKDNLRHRKRVCQATFLFIIIAAIRLGLSIFFMQYINIGLEAVKLVLLSFWFCSMYKFYKIGKDQLSCNTQVQMDIEHDFITLPSSM